MVIDKIAEKEKGGRVFIRKDPEKKEGYELRFEKSVEAYETHLEDLNMLLSDSLILIMLLSASAENYHL